MSKATDRLRNLLGDGVALGESSGATGEIRGWIHKDYVAFKIRVTKAVHFGNGLSLAAVEDATHKVRQVSSKFATLASDLGQFSGTGAGFVEIPNTKPVKAGVLLVGVALANPRGLDVLEKHAEIQAAMKQAGADDVVVDGR